MMNPANEALLQVNFANMATQQYLPGISTPLPAGEVAMFAENVFTQDEVDDIVAFWASTPYGGGGAAGAAADALPFLVNVPPHTLVSLPNGDSAKTPYPVFLPDRSPTDPTVGVWKTRPDDQARKVFAVRRNGPANNAMVPVGEKKTYRGNKDSPEYKKAAAAGLRAYEMWNQLYPDGLPVQPPFPIDGGAVGRMLVNIDRILWRWHWRAPMPLHGFDISHLAAPAHYHESRNPDSPYHTIGISLLESRELNESRKPCNMFGLWRRKNLIGTPIVTDEAMELLRAFVIEDPTRDLEELGIEGCCCHRLVARAKQATPSEPSPAEDYYAWPCYGPVASVTLEDPTLMTGGRYNLGPRKFKHPQKGKPGGEYHFVPTGPQKKFKP